jgi:hypothetical protein
MEARTETENELDRRKVKGRRSKEIKESFSFCSHNRSIKNLFIALD